MGQYYLTVNIDKRQYLTPHKFGDGLKLMEFANDGGGLLCGLAILLADGNGRGGGDLNSEDPLVGSWAGDRIVIAGDYADPGKFLEGADRETLQRIADEHYTPDRNRPENVNLYALASETFEDISDRVIRAIAEGEGRHGHPLAKLDLAETGWRHRPEWT